MGKQRKKTIVAGPLVYESIYPLPCPRDSRAARQGKKKLTSDAQQRMNQKYQWQKCELLMACNFRPGDIVLTLTFDDAHLPDSRAGVMRCVREFFKRLRARRNPLGRTLKYIYVVEHYHDRDDPTVIPVELAQQGRYHVHMILNATGEDADDIYSCWDMGLLEWHPFELSHDRTFESLARYLCKGRSDYVGARKFIPSRGLARPETDCQIVDSSETLTPPKDATVYDNTGVVRTEYGKFQFIKYLYPKLVRQAPRPPRKRPRRIRRGKRK